MTCQACGHPECRAERKARNVRPAYVPPRVTYVEHSIDGAGLFFFLMLVLSSIGLGVLAAVYWG